MDNLMNEEDAPFQSSIEEVQLCVGLILHTYVLMLTICATIADIILLDI